MHGLHTVDLLCSLAVVVFWMRKSYVHKVERSVMVTEWAMCAFFLVNYALRLLRAGLAPSSAVSFQARRQWAAPIPVPGADALALRRRARWTC